MTTDIEIKIDEKIKQKIEEPKLWKIIFLNDDYTPIDFVIELIMKIFHHSEETAKSLTMEIHNNGSAIVGIYIFEIAEIKAVEATGLARSKGFPLQIRMEEE